MIASLSPLELKIMARKAWEFVRANNTTENFTESYRNIVEKILSN